MFVEFLIIACISVGYWLFERYYQSVMYLKNNNIPQPPISDFFRGNGPLLNSSKSKEWCLNGHAYLGQTFGLTSGPTVMLHSSDADLVYRVYKEESRVHRNRGQTLIPSDLWEDYSLLANEDSAWSKCRTIIGCELTLNKIKRDDIQRDMNDASTGVCNYITRRAKPSAEIEVVKLFKKFTLDVVLRATYDQRDVVDYEDDNNEMLQILITVTESVYHPLFVWFQYISLLRPIVLMLDRITTNFRGLIIKLATEALKNGSVQNGTPRLKHKLLEAYKNSRLSKLELLGNASFMVLAGWDTTAQTLSALMWLLATHPDKQEKLRNDIMRDGHNSVYLDYCIHEALRLYPPVLTSRRLETDIEWKGMMLRKGMMLVANVFSLHTMPEYWGPDGQVFRPERFVPEESSKHHKAQFFAFGLGPRNCVGGKLALAEMQILVSRMLLEFSVELCDKSPKGELDIYTPLIFAPMIRGPVQLRFVKLQSK